MARPWQVPPSEAEETARVAAAAARTHYTGSCYCRKIRFAIDKAKLLEAQAAGSIINGMCHCFSCRRAHAAALYECSYIPSGCFAITAGAELVSDPAVVEKDLDDSLPDKDIGYRRFSTCCGTRLFNDMSHRKQLESGPAAFLMAFTGVFKSTFDEEVQRELQQEGARGAFSPSHPAANPQDATVPQLVTYCDTLVTTLKKEREAEAEPAPEPEPEAQAEAETGA